MFYTRFFDPIYISEESAILETLRECNTHPRLGFENCKDYTWKLHEVRLVGDALAVTAEGTKLAE
jgi:hypothetical protein